MLETRTLLSRSVLKGAIVALAALTLFLACSSSGPADATVVNAACAADNNIQSSSNGQVIQNLVLLNARQAAIRVTHNNVTVKNVRAEGFNCSGAEHESYAGVSCDGCSKLTVVDSYFKAANTTGGGGVHFESSGGGHLVARNTIIGGWDGIGTFPEDDPSGAFTSGIIEDNTISGAGDDCIQIEGRNQGVTVRRNRISNCGFAGIAIAPSWVGPLTIESNVVTDPGEECFKVGDGGSGDVHVKGNYCEGGSDAVGASQTNPGLDYDLHFYGNTFVGGRYFVAFYDEPPTSGSTFDYDCFDGVNPIAKWDGTAYNSLSSFQNATGQEMHAKCPAPKPSDGGGGSSGGASAAIPVVPTPIPTPTPTPTPTPAPTPTPTATPYDPAVWASANRLLTGPSVAAARSTAPTSADDWWLIVGLAGLVAAPAFFVLGWRQFRRHHT